MALVTRGRLSVQRVEEETWNVIVQLAEQGGWDEGGVSKQKTNAKAKPSVRGRKKASAKEEEGGEEDRQSEGTQGKDAVAAKPSQSGRRKRKAEEADVAESKPRRSTRAKR